MLSVLDLTDTIKERLKQKAHEESALEVYWQNKIREALPGYGLSHCRIDHGFITDLSNDKVVIEIKHGSQFRCAVGQVLQYSHVLERQTGKKLLPIICLFHAEWSADLYADNWDLCRGLGIKLILLNDGETEFADLKRVMPSSDGLSKRARLKQFAYTGASGGRPP